MQRPETGIKDGVGEVEHVHEFLFGPFRPKKKKTKKNKTIFSDVPLLPRRFSAGMTQKVEFHLLPNRIFRKLFVNGRQPWLTRDRSIFWLRSQATLICTAWPLNFRTEVLQCENGTLLKTYEFSSGRKFVWYSVVVALILQVQGTYSTLFLYISLQSMHNYKVKFPHGAF